MNDDDIQLDPPSDEVLEVVVEFLLETDYDKAMALFRRQYQELVDAPTVH